MLLLPRHHSPCTSAGTTGRNPRRTLGELGGLVNDHAAIDYVREATGNDSRLERQRATRRQDPKRDERGLAEAGGEFDVGRDAPAPSGSTRLGAAIGTRPVSAQWRVLKKTFDRHPRHP
jgi:hypothetical protein